MLKSGLVAIALVCAPAVLSGQAWAQKDDTAGIDRIYDGAADGCLKAHSDVNIAQETRLATCQAELTKTDGIYSGRQPATKHETNVYRMHRAFLDLEIGGAYLRLDKARSARVCVQTEAALLDLSLIVDSESPAAYQKDYAAMRTGLSKAIAQCRVENGTPPGAPPVPAGATP